MNRAQLIEDLLAGRTSSQGRDLGLTGQDPWRTQGDPDGKISRDDAEWLADQIIAEDAEDQAAWLARSAGSPPSI